MQCEEAAAAWVAKEEAEKARLAAVWATAPAKVGGCEGRIFVAHAYERWRGRVGVGGLGSGLRGEDQGRFCPSVVQHHLCLCLSPPLCR